MDLHLQIEWSNQERDRSGVVSWGRRNDPCCCWKSHDRVLWLEFVEEVLEYVSLKVFVLRFSVGIDCRKGNEMLRSIPFGKPRWVQLVSKIQRRGGGEISRGNLVARWRTSIVWFLLLDDVAMVNAAARYSASVVSTDVLVGRISLTRWHVFHKVSYFRYELRLCRLVSAEIFLSSVILVSFVQHPLLIMRLRMRSAAKKSQRPSSPEPVDDDGVFVVVREEGGVGVQVIRRSDTTSKKLVSKRAVGDAASFQTDGHVIRAFVLLLGTTCRLFVCVCCSFAQFRWQGWLPQSGWSHEARKNGVQ